MPHYNYNSGSPDREPIWALPEFMFTVTGVSIFPILVLTLFLQSCTLVGDKTIFNGSIYEGNSTCKRGPCQFPEFDGDGVRNTWIVFTYSGVLVSRIKPTAIRGVSGHLLFLSRGPLVELDMNGLKVFFPLIITIGVSFFAVMTICNVAVSALDILEYNGYPLTWHETVAAFILSATLFASLMGVRMGGPNGFLIESGPNHTNHTLGWERMA